MLIFGIGVSVNYFKQMHKNAIDSIKVKYGNDFSPAKVRQEQQKAMDHYRQKMEDYSRIQETERQKQQRLIEDQKRQMENLRRQSQMYK